MWRVTTNSFNVAIHGARGAEWENGVGDYRCAFLVQSIINVHQSSLLHSWGGTNGSFLTQKIFSVHFLDKRTPPLFVIFVGRCRRVIFDPDFFPPFIFLHKRTPPLFVTFVGRLRRVIFDPEKFVFVHFLDKRTPSLFGTFMGRCQGSFFTQKYKFFHFLEFITTIFMYIWTTPMCS